MRRPSLRTPLRRAVGLLAAGLALLAAPPTTPARAAGLDEALRALDLVVLRDAPAPEFLLERLADGKPVGLADVRGRAALLYFWATW